MFVVTFPRWVVIEINNRLRNGTGCLKKVLNACFGKIFRGLELWLRPLHHNAYTVVAVSGADFLTAAGIVSLFLKMSIETLFRLLMYWKPMLIRFP